MKRFTGFIYRFRITFIAVTLVLTVFFSYELKNLRVNSDVLSYLPESDPAVALFNKISENFGGNDLVLIAAQSDSIFSYTVLRQINELTQKCKLVPGVSFTTSITDVIDIKRSADSSIEIGKLIDPDNLPRTPQELAQIRDYTQNREMYNGRLISPDLKTALVICQLSHESDKMAAVKQLKKLVGAGPFCGTVYLGGVPVMIQEISSFIIADLKILIPIVSVLIILTLFVSFGNVRGVIIPLLSVGISTIWTLGTMSALHIPLTIISDIIPVLLIAVGTAPCIHIVSKFDEDYERYGTTGDKARDAFGEVGLRVILAAVTIIFGFTSFIFGSYLIMIKEFGIFSSIGVFYSLLISILFIPSVLSFVTIRKKESSKSVPRQTPVSRFMDSASVLILRSRAPVILAGFAILIFGAVGFMRIERKVDIIDYFKKSSGMRVTEAVLERNFGGSRPVQILVKGDIQHPVVLDQIRLLEKYLDARGIAKKPQSVADLIMQMNDVMDDRKIVPESRDKVTNLWFLLEGQEILPRFVNEDKTEALILSMVGTMDVAGMKKITEGIQNYLSQKDTIQLLIDAGKLTADQRNLIIDRWMAPVMADEILWDIMKRGRPEMVTREKIEQALQQFFRQSDPADGFSGNSPAPALPSLLRQCLPLRMLDDSVLVAAIADDLCGSSGDTMAVPQNLYTELGLDSDAIIEKVQVAMAYTGIPLIYQHLDRSLVDSQIQSFLIALVFIYLLLLVQLRSLLAALLGMLPIVVTVVLMFGIMGFAHIPIDVATVLAASIALGIGIDYSIHFSVRFSTYYTNKDSYKDALLKTLRTTGKAIIINALAVTMGFITLLFAELVPLKRFGILVAITMIGSGVGALTMLPVLMLITKVKVRSKVIE